MIQKYRKMCRPLDSIVSPWLVEELRHFGQLENEKRRERFLIINPQISANYQLHKSPSEVPRGYVYALASDLDCCIDAFFDQIHLEEWQNTWAKESFERFKYFLWLKVDESKREKPVFNDSCMAIDTYRLVFVPGWTYCSHQWQVLPSSFHHLQELMLTRVPFIFMWTSSATPLMLHCISMISPEAPMLDSVVRI